MSRASPDAPHDSSPLAAPGWQLHTRGILFLALAIMILVVAAGVTRPSLLDQLIPRHRHLTLLDAVIVAVCAALVSATSWLARAGHRRRPGQARLWGSLQVAGDVVVVTLGVFLMGGIESHVQLIYVYPVLHAALLLRARDAFVTAVISAQAYGLILWLQYRGATGQWPSIPTLTNYALGLYDEASFLFGAYAALCLVLIGVALIGSYLVARLRSREREVDRLNEQLSEVHHDLQARLAENLRLLQETARRRDEMAALLRGIGDGVLVTDGQGTLLMVNPVAEAWLGISEALAVGATIVSALAAGGSDGQGELCELLLAQQPGVQSREITLRQRACRVQVHPIGPQFVPDACSQAGPIAKVAILSDMTRERDLERAKADFLNQVAHDLRTVLTPSHAILRALLEERMGDINEVQRDFLRTAVTQEDLLSRLIDQLLDLVRMDAGVLTLQRDVVDLRALLQRIVASASLMAREKRLELTWHIEAKPLIVEGDALRLEEMFTNLVQNSLKFTDEGAVRVEARSVASEVVVTVRDTGCGIRAADLPHIFERFYRGSTPTRTGIGLGLAICAGIVGAHGGRIWVDSEWGQGAAFHVALPMTATTKLDLRTASVGPAQPSAPCAERPSP